MGLANGGFHTAELGVVAALQIEQMAAIIHYRDDHPPFVAQRFGFGGCSDALGVTERKHGFA
ncbi:MAG: hypothetical protein FD134_452 [Gallionellaceae bacterium]|nr:MAG: hypothetical protein FD134_452 [Gallionellaceae bacterium]